MSETMITYTCEKDGCTNERTTHKSLYDKRKKHYCSIKCVYDDRRKKMGEVPTACCGCEKKMEESDIHIANNYQYSVFCHECRETRYKSEIARKKKRRSEVSKKFNQIWEMIA